MNYKDMILESFYEDYDYGYDEYEDSYLEGYMYALQQLNEEEQAPAGDAPAGDAPAGDAPQTTEEARQQGKMAGFKAAMKTKKGKAAAIGVGGLALTASGVAINKAIKTNKAYNEYKSKGGALSKKEWIKAGRPSPSRMDSAKAAIKQQVMKESYENAFIESYIDACEMLGMYY